MTEKIRIWLSDGFLCVHVDDGVSKATVSLDAKEVRKLYAKAYTPELYAFAHKALTDTADQSSNPQEKA